MSIKLPGPRVNTPKELCYYTLLKEFKDKYYLHVSESSNIEPYGVYKSDDISDLVLSPKFIINFFKKDLSNGLEIMYIVEYTFDDGFNLINIESKNQVGELKTQKCNTIEEVIKYIKDKEL